MNSVADKLKCLRENKNVSMDKMCEDLSQIFDVSLAKSTISKWENGKAEPSLAYARILSKYFNVTLDYIISTEEASEKEPVVDILTKFPEEFTNALEARDYINRHQIFGSNGFDSNKLDNDEILKFANDLLEQMKMVSYKYKK